MSDQEAPAAGVQHHVPARLASVAAARPWLEQLPPHGAGELACLTAVLRETATRVAQLATRLPEDDEALVAALLVRAWASGIADSAAELHNFVADTAETSRADLEAAASARLRTRYSRDPVQARRDGLDLLAGPLLTPERHDPER